MFQTKWGNSRTSFSRYHLFHQGITPLYVLQCAMNSIEQRRFTFLIREITGALEISALQRNNITFLNCAAERIKQHHQGNLRSVQCKKLLPTLFLQKPVEIYSDLWKLVLYNGILSHFSIAPRNLSNSIITEILDLFNARGASEHVLLVLRIFFCKYQKILDIDRCVH